MSTVDEFDHQQGRRASGSEPPTYEAIAGRTAAIGALVGFLICTAAVFGIAVSGGIEPGGALALGAFVGMWGGAGFGFMVGGTKNLPHP